MKGLFAGVNFHFFFDQLLDIFDVLEINFEVYAAWIIFLPDSFHDLFSQLRFATIEKPRGFAGERLVLFNLAIKKGHPLGGGLESL